MLENYLNLIPEQYRDDVLEHIEGISDNVEAQCDILLYIISMLKEDENYLIEKWKNGKYCINADDYLEEKEIQEEQDRFIECPFKIDDVNNSNSDSDERCRKCGSNKVFSMSYQNRSGDEAMSSYLICHCGHKELRSG